jgi:Mechanosensitive ion channel, conserved TM helix
VTNILAASGADKAASRMGFEESVSISRLAGTLVLIFVFVPSLIAALHALQVEAISAPAINMLDSLMGAVPNLVAAALILIITYYVARFAAGVVTRIGNSIGLDTLPEKVGVHRVFAGATQPSRLAGGLVLFFAMLFAVVEAANQLEFTQVRDVVTMFIRFGGDVLLGAAIFIIGYWLANLAYLGISRMSGESSSGLARLARIAIMGLVLAMGLRAMGIADDIVNLAFALTFGAVAVAVALSFGLGGREAAGRQMEHWLSKLRGQ